LLRHLILAHRPNDGPPSTVNGTIIGFVALAVSTFDFSTLDSIPFQFPLDVIYFIFIVLAGCLSSKVPNIGIGLLVLCHLPILANSALIWRSRWRLYDSSPMAEYSVIGFLWFDHEPDHLARHIIVSSLLVARLEFVTTAALNLRSGAYHT
jgi:hypothetical protein